MTRRQTKDDPWEEPVNLGPPVSNSGRQWAPCISNDGSTLYFTEWDKRPNYGCFDIWQVSIEPVVDLNGDGIVDSDDIRIMVDHWGENYSLCDIAPLPFGNGIVDVQDLIVLAEHLFEEIFPIELVAYWKFDEEEGDIAYDSAGTNDAFVIGGPAWQPTGGQVDGALQLDGVDDCAVTSPIPNLVERPFSVFAWIKGGAPGQVVLSQMDLANWLYAESLEGNLMTELTSLGRSGKPLQSQTVITDGNCHRITLVGDCFEPRIIAQESRPALLHTATAAKRKNTNNSGQHYICHYLCRLHFLSPSNKVIKTTY
jgi:hypothetical protein